MRYLLIALFVAVVATSPSVAVMARAAVHDSSPPAIVADGGDTLLDGIDWDEWLLLDGIDWDEWLLLDGIDWDEWLEGVFRREPPRT
jgi:hypothetical protein